jgi:hypothetical protein
MQSYIKVGYGFSGKLLTDSEYEKIVFDDDSDGVKFVSFTEDYDGKEWGTVVLHSIGEIANYGKMSTAAELMSLFSQHEHISQENRKRFDDVLEALQLAHLKNEVTLVLYTANY